MPNSCVDWAECKRNPTVGVRAFTKMLGFVPRLNLLEYRVPYLSSSIINNSCYENRIMLGYHERSIKKR